MRSVIQIIDNIYVIANLNRFLNSWNNVIGVLCCPYSQDEGAAYFTKYVLYIMVLRFIMYASFRLNL